MMEPIKKLSKFKIPVQKKSLVPEYRIQFSRAIDVIGFLHNTKENYLWKFE